MHRILLACTGIAADGGIQRFNRNLVAALSDCGAVVDVVSLHDGPADNWKMPAAEVTTGAAHHLFQCAGSKPAFTIRFWGLLTTRRYDTCICGHLNLAPLFQLTLTALRRPAGDRMLILHGIEAWQGISASKRRAAARFATVLSVSRYTRNRFLAQVPGYPPAAARVFPNTISPDWQAEDRVSVTETTRPRATLRLLSVARLASTERDKGIIDVLKALARIGDRLDFHYSIVGDGDYKAELAATTTALGLADRVVFHGRLDDAALRAEYQNCDLFALPSGKEGFGIVYLEAMRFGLPVLAAAEKGALDVVRPGDNGFLVPFRDPDAIAATLLDAAADRAELARLGQNGQALVAPGGEFSFEQFRERSRRWIMGRPAGGTPAP